MDSQRVLILVGNPVPIQQPGYLLLSPAFIRLPDTASMCLFSMPHQKTMAAGFLIVSSRKHLAIPLANSVKNTTLTTNCYDSAHRC